MASRKLKNDITLFRPKNCRKYCVYNGPYGCEFRAYIPLKEPIKAWQNCQYFTMKSEEVKPERYYDVIYGRFAVYKDSHSAIWKN